jgi:hypothetical protein
MILSYQKGFKGLVSETFSVQTPIFPKQDISHGPVSLTKEGILTVNKDFPTDFASGPTIDWPKYILPISVIHDAFCYLHRQGLITEHQRSQADRFFRALLRFNSSKIWYPRWEYWYRGVRLEAQQEHNPKPIHQAEFKILGNIE